MNSANRSKLFCQRLKECMDTAGHTKTSLARELNARYETRYTHNDVRRWLGTGTKIFKPCLNHLEGVAAFPKFETIMNLADFFNVDVGYLIGETDMQSYSMEKVCNFTGLSDNAITTILKITGTQKDCLSFGYESDCYRSILSKLLSSEHFFYFIECLKELDSTICLSQNIEREAESQVGRESLEIAFKLYNGPIDYEHDSNAPKLPPEQVKALNVLQTVIDKKYDLSFSIKVARYELHEAFEKLVENLHPRKK